ncbi:MAG: histidine kinase [Bacteroidales bacterium]
MKRTLAILLNPFLLSLWVAFIVLLVFPIRVEKYRISLKDQGDYLSDQITWYDDLDSDGNSEKIALFHNSLGNAGLTVSNSKGVLDQWNFRGRYHFTQSNGNLIIGDRDGDGLKEIYVFTLAGDSILVHGLADYRNPEMAVKTRFVTRIGSRSNRYDPFILDAEMDDLTSDGFRELIFGIGTGYSLHPRRVYAYDMVHDTIWASPPSGFFIYGIIQDDINNDGRNEIIVRGYAAGNVHDSSVPYPDWNSYLMVLNRKLQFAFNPVSFPGQFSSVSPFVFTDVHNRKTLGALYSPPGRHGDSTLLMAFTNDGRLQKQIRVDPDAVGVMITEDKNGKCLIMLNKQIKGFDIYDNSFQFVKDLPVNQNFYPRFLDVDLDGSDEVILTDVLSRKIIIYRKEMNHPVSVSFKGNGEKGMVYSINQQLHSNPELYIQMGSEYNLFLYERNQVYNYRFLLYAAVYLSILLFTLLVGKIQQVQMQRKFETEKKIADLQLQIVRNQLDPHFVMNAVNSIIDSISDEEKEEARQHLLHFSSLQRSLLLSSDQVVRSLREEISFTESYLALEKFRFRDRFSYQLLVDPLVNQEIPVPKMILQIHVENALKHGILPLDRPGLLTIHIAPDKEEVIIQITDDGVGREYAQVHQSGSTGKGLSVMQQYSELFNRYNHGKIALSIEDLYDTSGKPGGTKVTIKLSPVYEGKKN